jgi:hypothetical protein
MPLNDLTDYHEWQTNLYGFDFIDDWLTDQLTDDWLADWLSRLTFCGSRSPIGAKAELLPWLTTFSKENWRHSSQNSNLSEKDVSSLKVSDNRGLTLRDYWGFRLHPLSDILKVQWLRLAKIPNGKVVSHPLTWGQKQIQPPECSTLLNTRWWTEV